MNTIVKASESSVFGKRELEFCNLKRANEMFVDAKVDLNDLITPLIAKACIGFWRYLDKGLKYQLNLIIKDRNFWITL